MLRDADVKKVRRWVDDRNMAVPAEHRDEYRLEIEIAAHTITIIQREPPWPGMDEPMRLEVARLRYIAKSDVWKLYWTDSNSKFHLYEPFPQARHVQALLREIDEDVTNIFWG